MPANVKVSDNQEKHRTRAEIQARQAAEAAVMPDRPAALKVPRSLNKDPVAQRYWKSILERMEGLAILDDLDSEMLAIYCSALSRHRALSAGNRLAMIEKLDGLMTKLQGHEKTLLSYADKLGMTPEARARLARKRATQETEKDPDADLFGD